MAAVILLTFVVFVRTWINYIVHFQIQKKKIHQLKIEFFGIEKYVNLE